MKPSPVLIVGVEPRTYVHHQAFIEAQVTAEKGWWMLESPHKWCDAVRDAAVQIFGSDAVTQIHRYRNLAQAFAHRVGLEVQVRRTDGRRPCEWDEGFAEDVKLFGARVGCIASAAHRAWSSQVEHIDPSPPVDVAGLPNPASTVESTPESLHRLLSPLMSRCKQMAICDPYLGASLSERSQRAVADLVVEIARRLGDRGPLLLHVGKRAGTVAFVRDRLVCAARARQDGRCGKVNCVSWSNVEDGPAKKPHDRWICTSRGGVRLGYGLQDFVEGPRELPVFRMSKTLSEDLLARSGLPPSAGENGLGWRWNDGAEFEV